MCAARSRPAVALPLEARGTTLVEVVIFVLIVSVAVTAVLNALSVAVKASSDPLVQRQTLAVAE